MKFIFFFLVIPFTLFAQPSPVTIISPQDSASAITSPIKFVWSNSPLALAYTIQISTVHTFDSTVVNQSLSDTTYSTTLYEATKYYWRVRAEDFGGGSTWSTVMFTTKLDSPQLLSPTVDELDLNLRPTLSWTSVFSTARYILQLSTIPDFSTIIETEDTSETNFRMDSLQWNTIYYWRVKAYIKGDTTTWSSVKKFTTMPNIPVTPNLLFPADISTNNAINVVLRWSKVQNATSYNLQISKSPIFSTFLKDSSITDTGYRPKPFFNSNTQYFWRVKAINSGGTSAFSGTNRFTTGADTNKAKISLQNINFGTVKAGVAKDTGITISNLGSDDLIIQSISNQLPSWLLINSGIISATSIAVSDTTIFVGTNGDGIFLSTNNGTNWSPVNIGILNARVTAFAVTGNKIFAGTIGNGVFLSTDNGTNWNAVNNGLPMDTIFSFAVIGSSIFVGTFEGVYLSTNNGANWSAFNNGFASLSVHAFAVSGMNLFAGISAGNGGLYLSTNNGTNWVSADSGLDSKSIEALAILGNSLFAGTWGGMYRSTNNGANWTKVNNFPTNYTVWNISVFDNILFASANGILLHSTNNGESWTSINEGLSNGVQALAFSGSNIFAATASGVFHSDYTNIIVSTSKSIITPGDSAIVSIHFNSIPDGVIKEKIILTTNTASFSDTILISGFGESNLLPVELTSFSSQVVGNNVQLNWSTATELNNFGFEIEKSKNNSQWIKIGFVEGNGTSNSPHSYSFNDVKSQEKSCYRLKQIDRDGKFKYSQQVEEIASSPKFFALFQNHPNPFNPSTVLSYSVPERSTVRLCIYNILGQKISDVVNETKDAGTYEQSFNASQLSSGIYFYRIEATSMSNSKTFVETKKMVLLR